MIQFMRGTKSQLNNNSSIIAAGQPVFESDTGQLKIGNGSSRYSALEYVGSIFENTSSGGGEVTFGGSLPTSNGYVDFPGGLRVCYGIDTLPLKASAEIGNGLYITGSASRYNLTRMWVRNLKSHVLWADIKPLVSDSSITVFVSGIYDFSSDDDVIFSYRVMMRGATSYTCDMFYWVWSRD